MTSAMTPMPRCSNRLKSGRVCNQKLGDFMDGLYVNLSCPRCHQAVVLDTSKKV